MSQVFRIAMNEFSLVIRSPMVYLFGILMLVLACTTAMEASTVVPRMTDMGRTAAVLLYGTGNPFFLTSMLFMFVATCLGVMSTSNDRSRGTLRVLITKPLYRRDIVLGKTLGIGLVLFLLAMLTEAFIVSLLLVFVGSPGSVGELILRAGTFAILLFTGSMFTLTLVMLIGIVLNKAEALVLAGCYISFEWLAPSFISEYLPDSLSIINPLNLYIEATRSVSNDLFVSVISYDVWLSNAAPYIVLLLAEIVVLVLINCVAINKVES
ncbi:MAG: ABC transporter permease subunit [Methanocella sp.]